MTAVDLRAELEKASRQGRPLLIHGRALDADALTRSLETAAGKGKVTLLDCRQGLPERPALEKAFAAGLASGRILHVAVAGALDDRLWDALLEVVSDGRIPGSRVKPSGALVLSAPVAWPSDLKQPSVDDYFPVRIGDWR